MALGLGNLRCETSAFGAFGQVQRDVQKRNIRRVAQGHQGGFRLPCFVHALPAGGLLVPTPHRTTPLNLKLRAKRCRARRSRLLTVPTGMPSIWAVSWCVRPAK